MRFKIAYFSHKTDVSVIPVHYIVLMVVLIIEKFYTLNLYPSGETAFPINPKNLIWIKPALPMNTIYGQE